MNNPTEENLLLNRNKNKDNDRVATFALVNNVSVEMFANLKALGKLFDYDISVLIRQNKNDKGKFGRMSEVIDVIIKDGRAVKADNPFLVSMITTAMGEGGSL